MVTLRDALKDGNKEELMAQSLVRGSVFRMHLGEEEGVKPKNIGDDGRNKYFVVLGTTIDGNVIGLALINTKICDGLSQELKDLHYPISVVKYPFLEINRFVFCGEIKEIQKKKFDSLFDISKKKGDIQQDDLDFIIGAVQSSSLIPKKKLKMFGLLP